MNRRPRNKKIKAKRTIKRMDDGITTEEALVGYKLEIMRDELFRLNHKKNQFNQVLVSKMQRLSTIRNEGVQYLAGLVNQVKDMLVKEGSITDSSKVLDYMKETWSLKVAAERRLKEIEVKILSVQRDTESTKSEIEKWQKFEVLTRPINDERIKVLHHEKQQIESRFCSIAAHMQDHHSKREKEINRRTRDAVNEATEMAAKRVLEDVFSGCCEDKIRLRCLKGEHDELRRRMDWLASEIDRLQKENIRIQEHLLQIKLTHRSTPSVIGELPRDGDRLHKADSMFDLKLEDYFSNLDLNDALKSVLVGAEDIEGASHQESKGSFSEVVSTNRQKEDSTLDDSDGIMRAQFNSNEWKNLWYSGC
ncbi:hypothetical protein CRM22_004693 [Opisthorchis felineus]|uniref:Uncharacterized protein n=1 Tax=Opisthorchis felineus TaxID=147828 RepID=A0A4S2LUV7_OPIFE|nr:hypothetical protein CRM22_004693 [Opisthorchis felineus]